MKEELEVIRQDIGELQALGIHSIGVYENTAHITIQYESFIKLFPGTEPYKREPSEEGWDYLYYGKRIGNLDFFAIDIADKKNAAQS